MERSATQDTEYVDIVLGYRHILVFSLVFGALIFSTGYFAGYHRAQSAEAASAAPAAPTQISPQASPPAPLPPVQVPAMLTEPLNTETGDVLKEMEELSQESLAPGKGSAPETTESATPSTPAAEDAAPTIDPRAETPARTAPAEKQEEPKKPGPQARAEPVDRKPANRPGNVYLQVSSFAAPQDAEKLIDDLAAEGFRALIDGQLIGGKHTVLVGPFNDFKAAAGRAKELKLRNREAFPIRR